MPVLHTAIVLSISLIIGTLLLIMINIVMIMNMMISTSHSREVTMELRAASASSSSEQNSFDVIGQHDHGHGHDQHDHHPTYFSIGIVFCCFGHLKKQTYNTNIYTKIILIWVTIKIPTFRRPTITIPTVS